MEGNPARKPCLERGKGQVEKNTLGQKTRVELLKPRNKRSIKGEKHHCLVGVIGLSVGKLGKKNLAKAKSFSRTCPNVHLRQRNGRREGENGGREAKGRRCKIYEGIVYR